MTTPNWWQQMQAQIEILRARYAALQRREQQMLLACAAAVVLAIAYLVIWQPVASARLHAKQALASARDDAVQIEHLQMLVGSTAHRKRLVGTRLSLLAAVDQASKASHIGTSPSRLQPDGSSRVRVWFENVDFNAVVDWIQTLKTRYGIDVENAQFSRKNKPGHVDVQLSLVRHS